MNKIEEIAAMPTRACLLMTGTMFRLLGSIYMMSNGDAGSTAEPKFLCFNLSTGESFYVDGETRVEIIDSLKVSWGSR